MANPLFVFQRYQVEALCDCKFEENPDVAYWQLDNGVLEPCGFAEERIPGPRIAIKTEVIGDVT